MVLVLGPTPNTKPKMTKSRTQAFTFVPIEPRAADVLHNVVAAALLVCIAASLRSPVPAMLPSFRPSRCGCRSGIWSLCPPAVGDLSKNSREEQHQSRPCSCDALRTNTSAKSRLPLAYRKETGTTCMPFTIITIVITVNILRALIADKRLFVSGLSMQEQFND